MIPTELPFHHQKNYSFTDEPDSGPAASYLEILLHKNYDIGMHSHNFYEINIVVNGKGYHYIDQKHFPVKTGDIFVIPPNIYHGYYSDSSLDVYHILIRNEFIRYYRQELEDIPGYKMLFDIEPCLRQTADDIYFLHLQPESINAVVQELHKMEQTGRNKHFTCQNIIAINLICNLCMKMDQHFRQPSDVADTSSYLEIVPLMEYIQNHLAQKLTLDLLAEYANMSRSTFCRQFKNILHISPMEYVINCRVERARTLIAEKTLTKAEIAQLCGFYDSAHMDKYLKQK